MTEGIPVLAIGLDAAEPTLLRDLIDSDAMPNLARLAAGSAWLRVDSPTKWGSALAWPSFVTGLEPSEHQQLYGDWRWDPDTMAMKAVGAAPLEALWTRAGVDSVGILDLPRARHHDPESGFCVTSWGVHEPFGDSHKVSPMVAPMLGERHPFARRDIHHADNDRSRPREVRLLSRLAMRGIGLRAGLADRLLERFRPRLALITFSELHRSGHYLWHTTAPADPLYDTLVPAVRDVPHGIPDLYREVDRQLGRILRHGDDHTAVFVFSISGMRPARGIVGLLDEILTAHGWCELNAARRATAQARALASIKARTPASVKRAYYAQAPVGLTHRIAVLMADYDWSRTRAFSLISDQNGWLRLNLAGREALGIVPESEYEQTCDTLEQLLMDLRTVSGAPVVSGVLRAGGDGALPDLVVDWAPSSQREAVRVGSREVAPKLELPWRTGEHTPGGFCLMPAAHAPPSGEIRATELQRLMLRVAGAQI